MTVPTGLLPAVLAAVCAQVTAASMRLAGEQEAAATVEGRDENLPIEEAARRLGVSVDYLYRHPMPFRVRIGRRILFSARGLERWIRQQEGAGNRR